MFWAVAIPINKESTSLSSAFGSHFTISKSKILNKFTTLVIEKPKIPIGIATESKNSLVSFNLELPFSSNLNKSKPVLAAFTRFWRLR